MSLSLDNFVDFAPSINMAGEHNDNVNKRLDAVVLFQDGKAYVNYVVNSNRPIDKYLRTDVLSMAIDYYNGIE